MAARDLIRLLLLSALWGASFLFMRQLAPVFGALPVALARVGLGALGLAALLAALKVRWRFEGKLAATLALGAINSGLPFAMYAFAAKTMPAGYSAILNALTPLMGVLVGAACFGDRPTIPKLAGVLLGLAGVAVLTRTGPARFDTGLLWSVAACLVATSAYALASFLTRRWITQRGGLDSTLVAFGSQLGAIVCLLPWVGWQLSGPGQLEQLTLRAMQAPASLWAAMAALGLLCTAAAYVLYFQLIARLGPARALSVTFLIPPFGVLWGALFLGEALSWAHAAGGALIGAALVLTLRPTPAPTPAALVRTAGSGAA